ncbi:MAG TPA: hypothetical protein PLS19_05880 [bacterium]|nr:hypothetical protein [bacterium]
MLHVNIANPVGIEGCHTGAVAREILTNGYAFPISQYTPEYYENSIIVVGILTVVPVWVMGLSRLSVAMTPFMLSFGALALMVSLLRRAGFGSGVWYVIVSFFFVSSAFVNHTLDAVGSHILGLVTGCFIIFQFYNAYISKKPINYYAMMLVAGFGLVLNLSSVMFTGLCILTYVFYTPAEGSKTRFSLFTTIKGFAVFILGAIPAIILFYTSKTMSVTYLIGVFDRRMPWTRDWASYASKAAEYLLVQFDGKLWLAVLNFIMVFILWGIWRMSRGRKIPECKRLLLYILCVFPIPIFAAVVLFSGGEFTTYHIYLIPFLFMTGAAVVSIGIDATLKKTFASAIAQIVLSFLLLAGETSGEQFRNFNFSIERIYDVMVSEEEEAFCYWRFGRSFGNHTFFNGNMKTYAKDMVEACGRFDTEQKKKECLWGWSSEASQGGFVLNSEAIGVLGAEYATVVSRSIGGWSGSLLKCFEQNEAFVGDCFYGLVERNALKIYSVKRPDGAYIKIPCLSKEREFSGLVEKYRQKLREPTGDAPQECADSFNMLCVVADAYCAAKERMPNFCSKGYDDIENAKLCSFIYEHTLISESAKKKLFASETYGQMGL